MAEESLRIKIGADIKDFEKGMKDVENTLTDIKKPLSDTGKSLPALGDGLTTVGNNARKVTPSVIGLSQALRDSGNFAISAQIGFLAISNNLPSVVDDFARYRKELAAANGGSASFTDALKGVAGSLIGPAGLQIAIGVAATAIPILIGKFLGAKTATDEASKAFEDFKKQLRSATDIQTQSAASLTGEIARINALVSVIKNETLARDQRLRALKSLQSINPQYFADLTLESSSLKTLTENVQAYTKALIQSAIVKGFTEDIAKLNVELAKQEAPLAQLEAAYKKLQPNVVGGQKAAAQFGASYQQVAGQVNAAGEAFTAFTNQSNRVKEIRSQIDLLNTALNKAVEEQTALTDISKSGGGVAGTSKELKELSKTVREFKTATIDFVPIFKLDREAAQQRLKELASAIAEEGRKSLRLPQDIYNEALKTAPKKLELKPQVVFSEDVKRQIENQTRNAIQLERLQGLATAATEIFSGILNPVVDSFFSNIEKGETVFQALGKSIKQFAANAVKDLLKLALLSGIKSLLFGGGIGGFGRSFTGGLSGLGGGIGGLLGGLNIGGVAPAPLSLNVGGQFNIRGTDLVASVNQANQRIGRVG